MMGSSGKNTYWLLLREGRQEQETRRRRGSQGCVNCSAAASGESDWVQETSSTGSRVDVLPPLGNIALLRKVDPIGGASGQGEGLDTPVLGEVVVLLGLDWGAHLVWLGIARGDF